MKGHEPTSHLWLGLGLIALGLFLVARLLGALALNDGEVAHPRLAGWAAAISVISGMTFLGSIAALWIASY